MSNRVTYQCTAGVATIAMDDGKANVMSAPMLREIDAALDRATEERAVVVLRSARPGVFSAGFDTKLIAAKDSERILEMIKVGAELALRLLSYPRPTIGVMEGHAFPMGAFLLLACDLRIGVRGDFKIGLNEVAIGIAPPGFAIELARNRLHPAWLNRTVTLGEMYSPEEAVVAGFLDRAVAPEAIEPTLLEALGAVQKIHAPSHALAKQRLRGSAMLAMRQAIDRELTLAAFGEHAKSLTVSVESVSARG